MSTAPERRPYLRKRIIGLAAALLAAVAQAAPPEGYSARVTVTGPTRLDWTFALASQSVTRPPEDWLPADYSSAKQTFELFVPPRKDTKAALPAVVFISPGNEPGAWKSFEKLCRARGVVFAGVQGAGNDVKGPLRVRIVLDVLDDLRRSLPLDPDRTYLAGFSGGARIASAVAFALPEQFGGVLAVGGSGDLRDEPWLRHRVRDRLSVALVTGPGDFNHGELTRLRGPYLEEVGVRTRAFVQPGLGHALPGDKTLADAFTWLEGGLKARQDLARKLPATRAAGAPDRETQAKALLDEGLAKVGEKATLYPGLMLIKGALDRWPDTKAAAEARKVLAGYEDKPDWQAEDVAEERRFLIARARALDTYASGPLPRQYAEQRGRMAKQALELWEVVLKDGPDTPAGAEARKRIPELKKIADKE